jgi:hypothetical protein
MVQTQRIELKENDDGCVTTFPVGRPIPRILVVILPPFYTIRRRPTQSCLVNGFFYVVC